MRPMAGLRVGRRLRTGQEDRNLHLLDQRRRRDRASFPTSDDARTGTVALWYRSAGSDASSAASSKRPYVENQLHGVKRSWYPERRPRAEFRYEHGALTEAQAWSTSGRP